jgi:hypothetical protein
VKWGPAASELHDEFDDVAVEFEAKSFSQTVSPGFNTPETDIQERRNLFGRKVEFEKRTKF